jgi:hypothetical protein
LEEAGRFVGELCFGVQAKRRVPPIALSVAAVVTMVHAVVTVMPSVVASVLRRDCGRGEQEGGQRQDAHNFFHR